MASCFVYKVIRIDRSLVWKNDDVTSRNETLRQTFPQFFSGLNVKANFPEFSGLKTNQNNV